MKLYLVQNCIVLSRGFPGLEEPNRTQPPSNTTTTIAQTPLNHKTWNSLLVLVKVRHYLINIGTCKSLCSYIQEFFLETGNKNQIRNSCLITTYLQPNNYIFTQPSETRVKSLAKTRFTYQPDTPRNPQGRCSRVQQQGRAT